MTTITDDQYPVTFPRSVPPAPVSAFEPADWRDIPAGHYAIPIWDWDKFADDVTPDGPAPVAELLGYVLFERKTPRVFKNGRKTGKDDFTEGRSPLVRCVGYNGLNAFERFRRAFGEERFLACHELRHDGDQEPPCRCPTTCSPYNDRNRNRDGRWKSVPARWEAWPSKAAAMILDGIAKHDDIYRKLYGQLTGHCGHCHRLLTDPTSKLIGIGPDCRGYR